MADIDTILSKHSSNYRFHGVRSATLERLIGQSEHGAIKLWGTDHDEHIDNQDGEFDVAYVQGEGFLYVTDISDMEMSFNEFCDDGGLVLVLEKIVAEPFEFIHEDDSRQCIINVQEWKVVGGLRPVVDEDGDVIDQEAFSVEEIVEM